MDVERHLNLNLVTAGDPAMGTVVKNEPVVDSSSPNFCRHVVIDVSGTQLAGNFDIGQAFGVIPELDHYQEYNDLTLSSEDRKLRLYSIASPFWGENGQASTLSTTCKRVVDEHWERGDLFLGVASNYLCNRSVGDQVKVTGPTGGHFILPDDHKLNDHQYVFFAAGTGIAPFRGMIMELLEAGVEGEIHLVFGVPYRTDIFYEDLWNEYEEQYDNFHLHLAISREQTTEEGQKMYVQRRMMSNWDRLGPIIENEDTLLYICGLKGMQTGIYRGLLEHECMSYFREIPDGLQSEDITEVSDRDERLKKIKVNKNRFMVEVY